MAPKTKQNAAEKQKQGEDEREEALQAVILADSFETKFSPFTLERPRCLLPLANTPLIEYTLQFLASAGVEEVFLYCGAHTQLVEEYINRSKWSSHLSSFSKLEIIRSTSRSIGDAMRDLDKRALMSGDFLLVYGDVVSNMPLEAALAEHRARRTADKNAIMTMVLREAGVSHRTKSHSYLPVFVVDAETNRCLHYEQMQPRQEHRYVSVDPDLLKHHQELDVREDLIDCGIDICTPDVLALWSDNFDYEAPRKGFLHSVLKDYELNGKTIYTHVVRDHYAARVRNLQSYDSVSKDIISRWSYPLCPDSNLVQGQSYRLYKGNIYKEENVALARFSEIKRRTVIGKGSSIGNGSMVSNSIIGRDCIIGRNVIMDGAYLWDSVAIGDGSVITQAVIADEAVIGKRCTIELGALISFGVRVADDTTISGLRRVTRAKRKRHDAEDLTTGTTDISIVGEGGDGFDLSALEGDDDEIGGLASSGLIYNISNLSLSAESISTLNSEASSEHLVSHHDRSAAGSFVSVTSEDSYGSQHASDFHHDAAASILDSLQKGDDPANIQLELTALRMSANASEHQVRRALVAAFTKRISHLIDESGSGGVKPAVHAALSKYTGLINRSMFDKEKSGKVDQVDFLLLVQADLCHRKEGEKILPFLAMELYDADVVGEEGFGQWWSDVKSSEGEEMRRVRAGMQGFVDALADAESGSSEEEEEGESEEEEG